MRYVKPGESFEAQLDNAPTGLTGTIGVQVIDTPGTTVLVPRTTAGIAEVPAGSGLYAAPLTAPTTQGTYSVVWDTGGASPQYAREELRVVSNPPTIPAPGGYCSPDDVRNALAPDGDPDGTLGTAASLSDDQLDGSIADGAAEINARLASRYSVPFAGAVPVTVAKVNADIAAYLATLTHSRHETLPEDHPIRLRYARALSLLTQIAKGEVGLLGEDGKVETSTAAEAEVINRYDGALFQLGDFSLEVQSGTAPNPNRWPVG